MFYLVAFYSRAWYLKVEICSREEGYTKSQNDPCSLKVKFNTKDIGQIRIGLGMNVTLEKPITMVKKILLMEF